MQWVGWLPLDEEGETHNNQIDHGRGEGDNGGNSDNGGDSGGGAGNGGNSGNNNDKGSGCGGRDDHYQRRKGGNCEQQQKTRNNQIGRGIGEG